MNSTLVHTTSTDAHRRHATAVAGIARVARAGRPAGPRPGSHIRGMCTACGAVEVRLDRATGTRDLSGIGESSSYPVGYGCEVCE